MEICHNLYMLSFNSCTINGLAANLKLLDGAMHIAKVQEQ